MHVKVGVEHRAVRFGRMSSKLSSPMMLTVRLHDTEYQVEADGWWTVADLKEEIQKKNGKSISCLRKG